VSSPNPLLPVRFAPAYSSDDNSSIHRLTSPASHSACAASYYLSHSAWRRSSAVIGGVACPSSAGGARERTQPEALADMDFFVRSSASPPTSETCFSSGRRQGEPAFARRTRYIFPKSLEPIRDVADRTLLSLVFGATR
jgi:hypothetical protein